MQNDSLKFLGVIPARFASTRFPGKPLALIAGKTMIERVYFQATSAKSLTKVVVATDDVRIAEHINSFGGNVMMTNAGHQSGTDRCAEVVTKMEEHFDAVVNIQGDEPFIAPEQIDLLTACLSESGTQIATLIKLITDITEVLNSNSPKVVIGKNQEAMYFSRQAIPFLKGVEIESWLSHHRYYKHIGIYGYKTDILQQLSMLPQSALEKAESLEQLRWLENGFRIRTRITEMETIAIDTPDDLIRAQGYANQLAK